MYARIIDGWFGPTTSQYVVLERPILSAMPELWQQRFVQCLQEFDDATQSIERPLRYEVRVKDRAGKRAESPVPEDPCAIRIDIDPDIQHERAVEFIRQLMLQYGISLSELDITGAS